MRGEFSDGMFLPTSRKELQALGWDEVDVILFSGDAYIDHPSFAAGVIARIIEDEGATVAVVPQPNWKDDLRDFAKLGRPRLFFAVTAGNMDSMVNHYTAAGRKRSEDAYSPGGRAGFRPDYPTIVYTKALKKLFPDVPVVIGGIEASLRRVSHYDYWKGRVERSLLLSSGADMLVYGMGERPVREVVRLLQRGVPFSSLTTVPQTAISLPSVSPLPLNRNWRDLRIDSHEDVAGSKALFAKAFMIYEKEGNKLNQARVVQKSGERLVVINPPFPPPDEIEADAIYSLPFTYMPHPRYRKRGAIPAYEMIKFSINTHRGCFGGCSFCAISAHQGKHIVSRSPGSVLDEIAKVSSLPGFSGVITDLGGPSANMYRLTPFDSARCVTCTRPSCIWPSVCSNLDTSHSELNRLYLAASDAAGIKHVFVSSGVRYDLLLKEHNGRAGGQEALYLDNLIRNHLSGWFKVAPEHTDDKVLSLMRKPSFNLYRRLMALHGKIAAGCARKSKLVPYFISGHPGATEEVMGETASLLCGLDIRSDLVQEFTPTPMTYASTLYYSRIDPYSGRRVSAVHSLKDKRVHKRYYYWYKQDDCRFITERLKGMGRDDLARAIVKRSGKRRGGRL